MEIAVNLHFKPAIIKNYFGDGSRMDVKLNYSEEPKLLGTAGGVKNVEAFLRGDEPFLVHYGDIITDQDFSAMLQFHRQPKALATLLLHKRAKSNSVVSLDADNRIIGFLERPDDKTREGVMSPWVKLRCLHLRTGISGRDPARSGLRPAARYFSESDGYWKAVWFSSYRLPLRDRFAGTSGRSARHHWPLAQLISIGVLNCPQFVRDLSWDFTNNAVL